MFELRPFERRNNHIAAYDPFREMENLERAFFGDRGFFSGSALGEFRTDIQDKGDSYLLEADLPGFKKDDIHIDLDGDTMTISAVNADAMTAEYTDGVLKLTMPKKEMTVSSAKRLEIR